MDKQEVILLVLRNLSVAFYTIDHKTFLEILEIVGNTKKWISSFLSCRTQHILISQNSSKSFDIDCCGVPQGSCLGPLLFTIYESRISIVVNNHLPSIHAYADDNRTQLYLFFKPLSTSSQQKDEILRAARRMKPPGMFLSEDLANETMEKQEAQLDKLKEAKRAGKMAYFVLDRLVIKDRRRVESS